MFGPVNEVGRGGDTNGVGVAVPLGVREDVGAIRGLDEAGVFHPPGPLAGLLGIVRAKEDTFRQECEMETIGGGGEAKAGGVHADLHGGGVIFRTIEDVQSAVAHNRCRIEGVEGLPGDRP